MRLLRPLFLALLALVVAVSGAFAQAPSAPTIKLPGGAQIKVKIPAPKPQKGKAKRKRVRLPKPKTTSVQVGISDQKATMFGDPRFGTLGFNIARRSIGWDFYKYDWQIADIDEWVQAARLAGVKPLITFARAREAKDIHYVPTRQEWMTGFREFRARWPHVTEFAATNESNHNPPTFKRPELAAAYYKDMRAACRTCKIAAATILEVPTKADRKRARTWIKRFLRAAGHQPKYWALHNYVSANKFDLRGTKELLKLVKGEIWITEVGGLVVRRTRDFAGKIKMKEGLAHSAKVTRFIFDRILTLSPRIRRVYLFHWNATGPQDTWDSGLVAADGTARSSLNIVQAKLKRARR
ncbi:MAG TPA: glycosyl hydrolase [Solirubrobacteraceae bacterium]|nr:glycosyl hydrolase [Solirubrobacteraceae bacterium]